MAKKDYKGQLINFCLKNKPTPIFKSERIGPPYDSRFICQVCIGDTMYGKAEGKQRKEAESKAAKITLQTLGYQETGFQPDFVALLHEFCQKKGWHFNFGEADSTGPSHIPEFTCSAKVNERIYPESSRKKNKKLAKKEAAYLALKELKEEFPNDIQELPDVFTDESKSENWSYSGSASDASLDVSLDRSTGENGLAQSATGDTSLDRNTTENGLQQPATPVFEDQQNYIAILNEICQLKRLICNYIDIPLGGPPHMAQFSCRVEIDGKAYPESKAYKTKKQAKKEAAFLALIELKKEFPKDIQDIPSCFRAESLSVSSSVSSQGNRTSAESGIAGIVTRSSEITFHSSCSTPSNTDRKSVQNGLDNLSLTDSELSSQSSSCGNNSGSNTCQNPLKDFKDITILDSGSFGRVFKARKLLDDRDYAVKEIPLKHRGKRHEEEVKALARLEHPNIVRYFNAWFADSPVPISSNSEDSSFSSVPEQKRLGLYLFIQMELCVNGSLKRWIKRRKNPVDKYQSLNFFRQIVEAVKYIHSQNLIHRDLKPANIFFTKDMVIKIGDFGLVTETSRDDESKARQRTQGTGTPSYMAPEQKEKHYENEVDIYALGLILVELLWIFGSGHERVVWWQQIREGDLPKDFVERYPVEVHEIKRMLSEDPKKRPSAEQLHKMFEVNQILNSRTQ